MDILDRFVYISSPTLTIALIVAKLLGAEFSAWLILIPALMIPFYWLVLFTIIVLMMFYFMKRGL